jgi:hypothetical protein
VIFYLGTHMPSWLNVCEFPLFVSRTRLARYVTLPRARGPWALDSGGFTQLDKRGDWSITPGQYVDEAYRYRDEIGQLSWAAPMDWMCEPRVRARTGLSISEHLHRTVDNYLALRVMAPDLPFIPVLQGWQIDDYLRCVDLYADAGINLAAQPLVGLGSICRRQATSEIGAIVGTLASLGLNLHGFGVKIAGLASYSIYLASADSMAWSAWGRRTKPCAHGPAKSEANCPHYARAWRDKVLTVAAAPAQLDLLAEAI